MSGEPFAGEVAQRLAVLIGMIMEDEVERAISTSSGGLSELGQHLEGLQNAAADIGKLAAAAEVVIRRYT